MNNNNEENNKNCDDGNYSNNDEESLDKLHASKTPQGVHPASFKYGSILVTLGSEAAEIQQTMCKYLEFR